MNCTLNYAYIVSDPPLKEYDNYPAFIDSINITENETNFFEEKKNIKEEHLFLI